MIDSVHLDNVAIFERFEWEEAPASINLVIGENDTGKSHLLKLLYAVTRSLRDYQRHPGAPRWSELLAEKLAWTFLPPEFAIGKLVRKGASRLRVDCRVHGEAVFFAFGPSTTKQITDASKAPRLDGDVSTLFFPPKEVLTTRKAILNARQQGVQEGFGDGYHDLAQALGLPTKQGDYVANLKDVMEQLEALFAGTVKQENDEFVFQRGSKRFSMSQTAEGVKQIGLLAHLIRNRSIQRGSILFFDEPAAHLHPAASMQLVEMLFEMAKADIQLFVATHSFVVLKQFELLAREHDRRVSLCVLSREAEGDGVDATFADLRDRIPPNAIVDASVRLFNRDVALSAK